LWDFGRSGCFSSIACRAPSATIMHENAERLPYKRFTDRFKARLRDLGAKLHKKSRSDVEIPNKVASLACIPVI
jgi:hypothetical protein